MEPHYDWPHDGRLHGGGAIQAEKRVRFHHWRWLWVWACDPGVAKWLQQRHSTEQAQNVYRAQ